MSLSKDFKKRWLGVYSNDGNNSSSLYKAPRFPWLPQARTNLFPKTNESDEGLFNRVRNKNYYAQLGLLEIALPPYLAPKYHQMNSKNLTKDESSDFVFQEKSMMNAVWYVNYCDTFGLHYLHELDAKSVEVCKYLENGNTDKIALWSVDLLCMLKSIGKCTTHEAVPQLSDCAQHSQDFLQEPSIIIQLPWNTVLFHQWLVAALLDVLTFEKHTLELRHWPLPPEIEPVATQLLLLVKHLKEKIYLGFLILSHQVIDYPAVDTRHPTWILDQVVLPSLAKLQFINISTGKGFEIVKSIKKLSWAKSECYTGQIYCAAEAYEIPFALTSSFGYFFYSPACWYSACIMGPFEGDATNSALIKSFDISKIINEELDTKGKAGGDYIYKIPSLSEFLLIQRWEAKLLEENASVAEKMQKAETVIICMKENIFDKERLPPHEFHNVMNAIGKCTTFLPQIGHEVKYVAEIVHHGKFCADLKQYLIEFDKETSILPHVVLLGYQIAEREQVIRITNLLSQFLGITPVDINVKKYKSAPMEMSAMLKCLSEVGERDRDWLWSRFPAQWRQPVTVTQPDINMDMGVDKIMKTCEDRIGRIIVNAAQTCFDVYQKGGDIFPDWKTVQYIMTCFVAMFIDRMKTSLISKNKQSISLLNYIKLIHGLLSHYERSYSTWCTNITPRQFPCTKSACKEEILADTLDVFIECDQYFKSSNLLIISHIQPEYPASFALPYFAILEFSMIRWLIELNKSGYDVSLIPVLEHEYVKIWLLKSLSITKTLYDVCVQTWQYPNQTMLLALHGYKQLFETNEVIKIIGKIFYKVNNHLIKIHYKIPKYLRDFKSLDNIVKTERGALYEWQFKLCNTLNPNTCDVQSNQTNVFESVKTLLLKMFNLYKQFRLDISAVKLPCVKYLPDMSSEHKILMDLYLKGDFETLESMLPLLFNATANVTTKSMASTSKSTENAEPERKLKEISANVRKSESVCVSGSPKTDAKLVNSSETVKMVQSNNSHTTKSSSSKSVSTNKSRKGKGKKTSLKMEEEEVEKRKKCRNCRKLEKKSETKFLICEACVKEKYPDVNYFCSVVCKEIWWGKEHMAEHLEFELGLLDFDK